MWMWDWWVLIVSFCLCDAARLVGLGPCESAHLIQLLYSSGILKAMPLEHELNVPLLFSYRSQVTNDAAALPDSGTIEELRFVIKKQEVEIQNLQEKWQNLVIISTDFSSLVTFFKAYFYSIE